MTYNGSRIDNDRHSLVDTADWTFETAMIEDTVLRWLWRVAAPFLLTVGTLGNILGLVVLTATPAFRGRRGGAIGFALSALCCVDIGVLTTSLLRRCLLHWTGFDISSISSVACRLHFFLVHVFLLTMSEGLPDLILSQFCLHLLSTSSFSP